MLGSTVPRKVSQAAQTAALMASWLTDVFWMVMSFMVLWCCSVRSLGSLGQVFGERLQLALSVLD